MGARIGALKDRDREGAVSLLVEGLGWSARGAEESLGPGALAAYDGERLLGVLLIGQVLDEAEVLALVVDPGVRRRGTARALLQRAYADLGPAVRIFLEVGVRNAAARRLYESEGFVESHRRVGYYADGSDAVVMVRG